MVRYLSAVTSCSQDCDAEMEIIRKVQRGARE